MKAMQSGMDHHQTTCRCRTGSLWAGLVVSLAVYSFIGGPLNGQQLEPRAFWPAPVGVNAVTFSLVNFRGDFPADPTSPLEEVDTRAYTTQAGYRRTV